MNDDDRDAILARRAKLIAALAFGGLTALASCEEAPPPEPCLSDGGRLEPRDAGPEDASS